MTTQAVKALIEEILSQTELNKIHWDNGVSNNSYSFDLKSRRIIIKKYGKDNNDLHYLELVVLIEGDEYILSQELKGSNDYTLLDNLYLKIKEMSATINKIVEDIHSELIGDIF